MTNKPLNIVILAAGKGTRMYSKLPKVLHQIAGKALLQHVIDSAKKLNPNKIIVVYGYGGDAVLKHFSHETIVWANQKEQLGTGHALQQALPYLDNVGKTLILLGDVPLINAENCRQLLEKTSDLGLMTFKKSDPTGYGRIVRNENGQVISIIEHKDATEQQRLINEVNTGIIAAANNKLAIWLNQLTNNNAQKEYYLTDIVGMAASENSSNNQINTYSVENEWEVTGVNSKQDLAQLERVYQTNYAANLLKAGVTLKDPARIDVRGEIAVGQDVEIDIGCIFEGKVNIADNVKIGAYCVLKNCTIDSGTEIAPFTHIDQAVVGKECRIGPYARLRPGTTLNTDTHIGNFVELKNTQVDAGSKINHLSYVGDTTVGKSVNIGAGTITCNYDGVNKLRTIIEDGAFIGSDSQLVAPVTIGEGATIGAGSTITKNAPAGELTLSRGRQTTIKGWKRPAKIEK